MVHLKKIFALSVVTMMLTTDAFAADAMDVEGEEFRAVCPTVDELNAQLALPQNVDREVFQYVNLNEKVIYVIHRSPRVDSIDHVRINPNGRVMTCMYKYTDPNTGEQFKSGAGTQFSDADGLPAGAVCRVGGFGALLPAAGGQIARMCGGAGTPQDCPMVCRAPAAGAADH